MKYSDCLASNAALPLFSDIDILPNPSLLNGVWSSVVKGLGGRIILASLFVSSPHDFRCSLLGVEGSELTEVCGLFPSLANAWSYDGGSSMVGDWFENWEGGGGAGVPFNVVPTPKSL